MKTDYKHIRFECMGDTGKTTRWGVFSTEGGDSLGEIMWFSRWRQYVFDPFIDTIYSHDCLADIQDFIKQLMALRKPAQAQAQGKEGKA